MWLLLLIVGVPALAALYATAFAYGSVRWRSATQVLRERLDASRAPARPQAVDFRELDELPAPVRRYLRAVLEDGQPVVTGVHLRHRGTFDTSETAEQWRPFASEQWVVPRRPGFVWNGRIALLPGVPVRVHDAYVAGEGVLHASLLGLVSVADQRGRGALAEGELMRYLVEATWYPTALLPSQGVAWEAIDDRSAAATLTDGDAEVTMRFAFDGRGLVETVSTEARGRTVDGEVVPTPWRGRFWDYEERGGMRVPLRGEVAWLLPEGEKPYWRGRITDLHYEYAR